MSNKLLLFFTFLLSMVSTDSAECVGDVMMVLDHSGSIDTDWVYVAQAVEGFVKQYKFTDGRGNRLGFVVYASTPTLECPMSSDQQALLKCVATIPSTPAEAELKYGVKTHTYDAIDLAGASMSYPARNPKMVIITDGQSANTYMTVASANKQKANGITMIAIGVGDANLDELQQVASNGELVMLEGYQSLSTVTKSFTDGCLSFTQGSTGAANSTSLTPSSSSDDDLPTIIAPAVAVPVGGAIVIAGIVFGAVSGCFSDFGQYLQEKLVSQAVQRTASDAGRRATKYYVDQRMPQDGNKAVLSQAPYMPGQPYMPAGPYMPYPSPAPSPAVP